MRMLLIRLTPIVLVLGFLIILAPSALACGGLVAPNGAIRLSRATTLVAWHDGVEHYMTSFTYEGDVSNLGWIVPLPAVPLKIQEGGAWTFQRLSLETHPVVLQDRAFGAASTAAAPAQVLQQVKIEALNVTVLRGSGQAVLDWCASNGFYVNDDTRTHLLIYAKGSPIFMAVKYDARAARARHQLQGDGSPLLITMRTPRLWVPLEVLALDGQSVNADLYLLTDQPANTSTLGDVIGQSPVGSDIQGATGFKLAFQEPMNPQLYYDLSTDRNMSWVRSDCWLTYLSLDAPSESVTYDLSVTPAGVIQLAPFGTSLATARSDVQPIAAMFPHLPIGTPEVVLIVLVLLAGGACTWLFISRSRSANQH